MQWQVRSLCLGAAIAVTCGCSSASVTSAASSSPAAVSAETYAQWCQAWGLTCPAGAPPNVPGASDPWSAAQWQGLFEIVGAAAGGNTDIAIKRAELDDAGLASAVQSLGFTELLTELKARLDASSIQTLTLAEGALTLQAGTAADDRTDPSGLISHTTADVKIAVDAKGTLNVSGLTLASTNSSSDTVQTFAVTGTNVMTWSGAATSVTGAPIEYLGKAILGMDMTQIPASMPAYAAIVPAVAPLVTWITTGQRDIDATGDQLAAIGAQLPAVWRSSTFATAFGQIIGQLSELTTTAASRQNNLLDLTSASQISCNADDEAQITADANWGVTSVQPLDDGSGGVTVNVYGLTAKRTVGLIRPEFNLDRLDLTPTSITIYNVPIIGTYTFDMSGSGDVTFDCGDQNTRAVAVR